MKALASLTLVCALLGGTAAKPSDEIKVLTQNHYPGADLVPLLAAGDDARYGKAMPTSLTGLTPKCPL